MADDPTISYVAGGDPFMYPAAGDQRPPPNAKVLLLTRGGICIIGNWGTNPDNFYLGWAPLPKRDRIKENQIGLG